MERKVQIYFFKPLFKFPELLRKEYNRWENISLIYKGLWIYAHINVCYIPISGSITILGYICNITGMVTSHICMWKRNMVRRKQQLLRWSSILVQRDLSLPIKTYCHWSIQDNIFFPCIFVSDSQTDLYCLQKLLQWQSDTAIVSRKCARRYSFQDLLVQFPINICSLLCEIAYLTWYF